MKKLLKMMGIMAALAMVLGMAFVSCADEEEESFKAEKTVYTFKDLGIPAEYTSYVAAANPKVKDEKIAKITVGADKITIESVKEGKTDVTGTIEGEEVTIGTITVTADGKNSFALSEEIKALMASENDAPAGGNDTPAGGDDKPAGGNDTPAGIEYSIANFGAFKSADGVTMDSKSPPTATTAGEVSIEEGKIVMNSPSSRIRIRDTNVLNYNGDTGRYVAVDTSKFGASGKLEVVFTVSLTGSAGKGGTNQAVYLTDDYACSSDGTATTSFDPSASPLASLTGLNGEAASEDMEIKATVDAGTKVYCAFSRGGGTGGGMDIKKIEVKSAK